MIYGGIDEQCSNSFLQAVITYVRRKCETYPEDEYGDVRRPPYLKI